MKNNTASETAQYMALFRALESVRAPRQRLFYGSYAVKFLRPGLKLATFVAGIPGIGNIIHKSVQHKSAGAYSSGVARTKYIDDLLYSEVQRGDHQVVILGAGFDTRSVRLDFLKNTLVMEIDHPYTSRMKKAIVQKNLNQLSSNTQYWQIDFNSQSLDEVMNQYQIDFTVPTIFIWEGVTNYIPLQAIDTTFEFIKKFPAGSSVIFTYIHRNVFETPEIYEGIKRVSRYLDESEERWTTGFLPEEMPGYLSKFNLTLLSDIGAEEFRNKLMPAREGYLNGYEFYRIVFAKI